MPADELLHGMDNSGFTLQTPVYIGFNWEEVQRVSDADIAGYEFGDDITLESAYPTGALLKTGDNPGVYYVDNGVKHPIYTEEILQANFKGKIITTISADELDRYESSGPVLFRDGNLIKSAQDNKVYVIANGQRHWITTEEIFDKFGYQWDNLIITAQSAIDIHPLGDDLK